MGVVAYISPRKCAKQVGMYEFLICCPIHKEKTPSCLINEMSKTYYCFGCGESGELKIHYEKES